MNINASTTTNSAFVDLRLLFIAGVLSVLYGVHVQKKIDDKAAAEIKGAEALTEAVHAVGKPEDIFILQGAAGAHARGGVKQKGE